MHLVGFLKRRIRAVGTGKRLKKGEQKLTVASSIKWGSLGS